MKTDSLTGRTIFDFVLVLISIAAVTGWVLNARSTNKKLIEMGFRAESRKARIDNVKEAEESYNRRPDDSLIRNFIFGVSDPEPEIAIRSDAFLQRISGKEGGWGLTEVSSSDEQILVMKKWCEWYLFDHLRMEKGTPE